MVRCLLADRHCCYADKLLEPFRQARPSQYSQYLGTPSELYGGAGQVRTQESGRMNNAATDVTRFDLSKYFVTI